MPPLLLQLVFNTVENKAPLLVRPVARAISGQVKTQFIRPQQQLHFDYLENELRCHAWFVGDVFSAADIMLSFPIEAAMDRAGAGERCLKLREFVERIHARPAYQRALERGGPYAYA